MKYRFAAVVTLKRGLADPQGKAIQDALPHMGWNNVSDVSVGKHIELTVEAADEASAREEVREIGRRLLANPVIEEVQVSAVPIEWMQGPDGRWAMQEVPESTFELQADLVLLAMGFLGPERNTMLEQLAVRMTERGTVWRDEQWMTSVPGVFTAGDMQRGQSLVVWAIAEGRSCARGVDAYLMGRSELPAPVR